MPSKKTSPFASSFKSGINSGKSCSTVINSIAKRTNKPVNTIIKSLSKAGLCCYTKFNGQYVCWPAFSPKCPMSTVNQCQTNMWQWFVDWCIASGCCTPNQLTSNCTGQKSLMNFCRSFFAKQFNSTAKSWHKPNAWTKNNWPTTTSSQSRKRTTSKSRSRKTTSSPWGRTSTSTRSYKFPTLRTRSTSRRFVKAA